MAKTEKLFTRQETARAIGISVRQLARFRRRGLIVAIVGPTDAEPDAAMNATRYPYSEIMRFIADNKWGDPVAARASLSLDNETAKGKDA